MKPGEWTWEDVLKEAGWIPLGRYKVYTKAGIVSEWDKWMKNNWEIYTVENPSLNLFRVLDEDHTHIRDFTDFEQKNPATVLEEFNRTMYEYLNKTGYYAVEESIEFKRGKNFS